MACVHVCEMKLFVFAFVTECVCVCLSVRLHAGVCEPACCPTPSVHLRLCRFDLHLIQLVSGVFAAMKNNGLPSLDPR